MNEHIAKIRENRYVQALFSYGIIPLTILLEEYEQAEDFEECQIILDTINFVNKYTESPEKEMLPTKYSPELVKTVKSNFNKFGFKGDIAMQNTPHYVEEIKKMVNEVFGEKYKKI